MSGEAETNRGWWAETWPDGLAFVVGLWLAWYNNWQTKDLVWSLWLSSLVVGYALIVWNIFGPGRMTITGVGPDGAPQAEKTAARGLMFVGGFFLLAFFTVHFGGFHLVHSMFLNSFFPVFPHERHSMAAAYVQVVRDYWPFVLVAAVAERQAFRVRPAKSAQEPPVMVYPAVDPPATARPTFAGGGDMMAPYKNVIRLHLLIFFFAFASIKNIGGFAVYAVVYAVYFFPWRMLKR